MKRVKVALNTMVNKNLISNWRKSGFYVAASDSVVCRRKSYIDLLMVPITCKKGDKVSVSWECRGSGKAQNFFLEASNGDKAASPVFNLNSFWNNALASYKLTGKWQRLWITYTAPRDYNGKGYMDSVLFRFYPQDNSEDYIEARNFKVELGAYPTDYEE